MTAMTTQKVGDTGPRAPRWVLCDEKMRTRKRRGHGRGEQTRKGTQALIDMDEDENGHEERRINTKTRVRSARDQILKCHLQRAATDIFCR
jgi:hypothetical protein